MFGVALLTCVLAACGGETGFLTGAGSILAAPETPAETPKTTELVGKFREADDGWHLIRSDNQEDLLVLPKAKYPKNWKGFRTDVEYKVKLRDGVLVEAHSLGGEPKR